VDNSTILILSNHSELFKGSVIQPSMRNKKLEQLQNKSLYYERDIRIMPYTPFEIGFGI